MSDETRKHIARVNELLHLVVKLLLDRGDVHDASKLADPEVETFAKVTERLSGLTFGSQEYDDCLLEMKPALDHHYAKNRHHPQHFPNGVTGMTLIDVVEMLCDWKASSERQHDGNILKIVDPLLRIVRSLSIALVVACLVQVFEPLAGHWVSTWCCCHQIS